MVKWTSTHQSYSCCGIKCNSVLASCCPSNMLWGGGISPALPPLDKLTLLTPPHPSSSQITDAPVVTLGHEVAWARFRTSGPKPRPWFRLKYSPPFPGPSSGVPGVVLAHPHLRPSLLCFHTVKENQSLTHIIAVKKIFIFLNNYGTSLVAQWLRIRLPAQGTRV